MFSGFRINRNRTGMLNVVQIKSVESGDLLRRRLAAAAALGLLVVIVVVAAPSSSRDLELQQVAIVENTQIKALLVTTTSFDISKVCRSSSHLKLHLHGFIRRSGR